MKVKLLKKLRAKARKMYWIEHHAGFINKFWVMEATITGDKKNVVKTYNDKNEAIKALNIQRRVYILSHLVKRLHY